MRRWKPWLPCCVLLLCCGSQLVHGQEARPIAARVNGEPVYASEADAEFRLAYGDKKFSDAERQQLMRAALDQVIDRRLVMAYLTANGQAASKADVDLELAQFEKRLKTQNLTLAQHCERVGLTVDDVRQALAWKLSWKRYCQQYLTPVNIEKYFDRNRREFDGTQLRVAQILLKLAPDADEAAIATVKERAAKLREEITGGKTSFANAAKQHSQSPSRDLGGDIGWIERHRPMPEDFSRLAFRLKKDEVSEPLVSAFGVHLITLLDEKPGQKTWQQADGELRPAVTLYLFRWLADKERMTVKIEYLDGN